MEVIGGVSVEIVIAFVAAMGVPSAITGLLFWWLKKHIDKTEVKREEREANREKLHLMNMRIARANNVLAVATAKAVQRIPDAHCNGDMSSALEAAAAIQAEEKDFLMEQGIKHIFDNE